MMADSGVAEAEQTIAHLRALLIALKTIDLPKTMVIVSEGFVMDDQQSSVVELGNLAIEARTSIYALKLDDQLFDMAQARRAHGAVCRPLRTGARASRC